MKGFNNPDGWAWPFRCSNCGRGYPSQGFLYRCPTCGGHFDLVDDLRYAPGSGRGLERYRTSFPLPPGTGLTSLGEGGTPLLEEILAERTVYLKCEHLNPTGSFKDRGTAVLVSALKAAGVEQAVEDSSGNAGASFAAYASRAGISARVYVPEYASGPKRSQIEAYGAELVPIAGSRSATTEAALRAVDGGLVYASHAHMPHIVAGMATIAFEIAEALGRAPGTMVVPVGQGTLLLGAYLGFKALMKAKVTESIPALIGVQAKACAPLWAEYEGDSVGIDGLQEQETIAEGIRILQPLRGEAVLRAVDETGGTIIAVEEAEIKRGLGELARRGFLVEPTSAVIWPVLEHSLPQLQDPVVAVLTGSGFKSGPESWPVGTSSGALERTKN